jgi:hypothetical protein
MMILGSALVATTGPGRRITRSPPWLLILAANDMEEYGKKGHDSCCSSREYDVAKTSTRFITFDPLAATIRRNART